MRLSSRKRHRSRIDIVSHTAVPLFICSETRSASCRISQLSSRECCGAAGYLVKHLQSMERGRGELGNCAGQIIVDIASRVGCSSQGASVTEVAYPPGAFPQRPC